MKMVDCPYFESVCVITGKKCGRPSRCSKMLLEWKKYHEQGATSSFFRISYAQRCNGGFSNFNRDSDTLSSQFVVFRGRVFSSVLSDLEYRPDIIKNRRDFKNAEKRKTSDFSCNGSIDF